MQAEGESAPEESKRTGRAADPGASSSVFREVVTVCGVWEREWTPIYTGNSFRVEFSLPGKPLFISQYLD